MHNHIIALPPGCAEIAKAAQLNLKIFIPEHASKREISRLSLLLDESISPIKSILQDSSDTRTSLELEKKLKPKKAATFLYDRRGYFLSPTSSIDEDVPEYELILPARDDLHTKRGCLKRRWSI